MDNSQNTNAVDCYALVKIGDRDKLVPTMDKLYLNDHVLYCDAVDGDYDLILLLQGASDAELDAFVTNEIRSINGVTKTEACVIMKPGASDVKNVTSVDATTGSERYDASLVHSYLFVEIEKAHFPEVHNKLAALECVTECDATRGRFDLVLLIRAAGFDLIRKVITEKIRPLPGVLRVKQSRIIRMFEM